MHRKISLFNLFILILFVLSGCTLPPGQNQGDLVYWTGSDWVITPAPPSDATSHTPVLTLCGGVPTWSSTACGSKIYTIGDTGPAGGIVFYVTDGGRHGLEAAPTDFTGFYQWGCFKVSTTGPIPGDTDFVDGADGTAIGTGPQNTADIVVGCEEEGIAAKVAHNYWLNGFHDWFLPSKDELALLCQQQASVGGFASEEYWTSTETTETSAAVQHFGQPCDQGNEAKYESNRIRFIRQF